jgi:hypothetical protein
MRAFIGALALAGLALVAGGCHGDGSGPKPGPGLPVVTVSDVEPGVFDVVLRPEVAGGEPLRGLEVELGFDPMALAIDQVKGGPAAGRMDTVFDDGARQPGVLVAGVTDLRKVALPLSGGALRVRYRVVKTGKSTITVNRAIGARAGGQSVALPVADGDVMVR